MNCTDLCNEGLYQGSEYCCGKPPQGGVSDRMILFNWDNLETIVVNPTTGAITDIVLKQNTKAYAFIGVNGSNIPQTTYTPTTFLPQYDHQIQFLAFDTTQKAKTNYQTLALKPVICIIEKTKGKTQGGDDSFEVFGLGVGMLLSDLQYLPADPENGGVYQITVKSNDNKAKESELPKSFWDTDYATTVGKINAFLNLPFLFNISPLALAVAGGNAVTLAGDGFFENGLSIVTAVDFVNNLGALTSQATFTVDSDNQISFTSVALVAGTYSLRITTNNGTAESQKIIVVS